VQQAGASVRSEAGSRRSSSGMVLAADVKLDRNVWGACAGSAGAERERTARTGPGARAGVEARGNEPARGRFRVVLKYGLVNAGAVQVRRERARGGVCERTARTRVAPDAGVQGERVRGRAERAQILAALEQVARGSNGTRERVVLARRADSNA
jgi:hypothetical protein